MATVESALQTALAHHQAGRLAEAEAICRRVLEQVPDHAVALHLVGTIALQQQRPADALAPLRRAISADARQAAVHVNLGEAHRALGQLDEARACYERAIELEPNCVEAHHNLGLAQHAAGDIAPAQRQFERAIQIQPDHAEAHYNLGCVLLLRGDFERGWHEHAWRLRMRGHPGQRLAIPVWDGSPLPGKRLLVYGEQGLGDTMQFIRYLPLVEARAAEVVVMVQPAMIPILTASGFKNLVAQGARIGPCDAQCSLFSLPGLLGTTLDTVPAKIPYLWADPQLVEHWRALLEPVSAFKVGIAWQGNAAYYWDRFRSIPLAAFEPVARLPRLRLISLQVGDGAHQIDDLSGRFEVVRFDDRLDLEHGPFMDTAAAMMHLDLVVTSDTAIAHLAGALGVPVYVALCTPPDWRWMLGRPDSPWYPTMRLFRQGTLNQWSDVFDSIADAITEHRQL